MLLRFAVSLLSLAAAQGAVIHSYDATSGGPDTQAWGNAGGVTSGASATDLGQTAWQMTGNNCCGYWFKNLTATQWTDAFDRGWSLSGTVRTTGTTGTGYLFLDTTTTFNRYDLSFGNDGTNGWAGLSSFFDAANPAGKTTLTDNEYHLLDMRYDPITQTASLWIDGVQVQTGYTGHAEFRESHGPAFGVTGFTTNLFIRDLQFSISDPDSPPPPPLSGVPEPSTLGLGLVGAALIGWRRRRTA